MFKKNTAVTGFTFGMVSKTDGSDITTGTPVGYVTLDGGVQAAIGDVTPVHEGNGQWSVDLTAGELNGDIIGLVFTHGSAISVHFTIKTDTKIVSELNDIADTAIVSGGAINTTGGAVDTVTDLTNLPAITPGWLTNTGIAAAALNGMGDWNTGKTGYSLTQSFPANFSALSISVGGAIDDVVLVATTTNNTDMRGTNNAPTVTQITADIDANSADLDTIIAYVDELETRLNTSRAGYLDNLSGGAVALEATAQLILADTASGGIPKNAAFPNFQFPMVLSSDHYTAAVGLTVTGEMRIDNAAFVAVNGTITEVSDGLYEVDFLAADTNGDTITYKFSAGTADDTLITIITRS